MNIAANFLATAAINTAKSQMSSSSMPSAFKEITHFFSTIRESVSNYGAENTKNALSNLKLERLGDKVKDIIKDSNLAPAIKDKAMDIIDSYIAKMQKPTIPATQDFIDSKLGGQINAQADNVKKDIMSEMFNNETVGVEGNNRKEGKDGKHWLVALAEAMGNIAGKHLKNMIELADKIGNVGNDKGQSNTRTSGNETDSTGTKTDPDEAKKMAKLQAEFQAESQMFKMVSESASTLVKSIGESLSTLARKQ